MSQLALQQEPSLSLSRLKTMDIGEDGHDFELYKTYPYFVDVLEWLHGTRPYQNIRHGFGEAMFRVCVLPQLLTRLRVARLIRKENGRFLPCYEDVILRGMPRDSWVNCEIAVAHLDENVKHCLDRCIAPSFETARTKAQPSVIAEWQRRLSNLFAEIDEHDDPHGADFSLSLFGITEG